MESYLETLLWKQTQLSSYWAQQESIAEVPQYTVAEKNGGKRIDGQESADNVRENPAQREAESVAKAAGEEVSAAEQTLSQWKALETAAENARSRGTDEKIGQASGKILSVEAAESGLLAGASGQKETKAASENAQWQMQEISRFFERDARRYG